MSDLENNPREYIKRTFDEIDNNATANLHHAAKNSLFSCPLSWQAHLRVAIGSSTAFDFGNVDLMSFGDENVDLANPECPTLLEFWLEQRAQGNPLIAVTEKGEWPLAILLSDGPNGSVSLLHLNKFTEYDCATWRAYPVSVIVHSGGSTATAASDATWKSNAELAEAMEQVLARTAGFEGLLKYWRKSPFTKMSKTFLDWGAGQRPAMMFELRTPA